MKKRSKDDVKEIGIKTIITLNKPYPKSKLKPMPLYEWVDEKKRKNSTLTKVTTEDEKYLAEHNIFVKKLKEDRTGRRVNIGGIILKWVDEFHLEFTSANETEARIKFHSIINRNLNLAGYEAKTKCSRLYQGEEELDCMDENLNKYKK